MFEPVKIKHESKVVDISAGDTHFGMVTSTGSVHTCGSNNKGQLGHNLAGLAEVPLLKSQGISCGCNYTILLTENGELMISGALPFKVNNQDFL